MRLEEIIAEAKQLCDAERHATQIEGNYSRLVSLFAELAEEHQRLAEWSTGEIERLENRISRIEGRDR